jgi:hypothetical protein
VNEWRWLASTRKLQEEAFGVDFSKPETGNVLADNAVHQGFALIIELAEAFSELQWKDWAENRGDVNRDALVGELVDAGHFLANLLVKFGVTDDEWERLYQEKQDRNRKRQAAPGGYDAVATKCPRCGRELDKPGAVFRDGNSLVCRYCDLLVARRSTDESELVWNPRVDVDLVEELWQNTPGD